ncbi:MAG: hypothetical protein ABSD58_05925 [Verrucomicrobiia bacterium]|jgi:hypothetical protein
MKVVTKASRRNEKVQIMKTKAHKAVGVCRAIRTLLLIGGVALAYCSSTNAAITSGTITTSPSTNVFVAGSVVTVNASFIETAPTNAYTATVTWGDGTVVSNISPTVTGATNIAVTAQYQYKKAASTPFSLSVAVSYTNLTGTDTQTLSGLTVSNAPLSVVSVLTTNSAPAVEGNLANLTLLTFDDGNPLATNSQYTLTITPLANAGNIYSASNEVIAAGPTTSSNAQFNVQAYLEFYAYGTNTFVVTVAEPGQSFTATSSVVIADAPLALVSEGSLVFTEGLLGTNETLLTFVDSNNLANASSIGGYVAFVRWGDGTSSTFSNDTVVGSHVDSDGFNYGDASIVNLSNNVFEVVANHVYPSNFTYSVTVQVNDIGGAAPIIVSGDTSTVVDAGLTVVQVDPALSALPGYESLAQDSGNALGQWVIAFSDTNEFASVPPISVAPYTEYLAMINWGDGSPNTVGTVVTNNVSVSGVANVAGQGTFLVYGNHTYSTNCAQFSMSVLVQDIVGTSEAAVTATVSVTASPITTDGYTVYAAANDTYSGVVASFTDPDTALNASSFSATINWGDGTLLTTNAAIVTYTNGVYLVDGAHTYVKPASTENVTVTVYDNVDVCATPVLINSQVKFITGVGITPVPATTLVTTGTQFCTNVATFTDSSLPAGLSSDLSAVINWGDGFASDGSITPVNGQYVVSGCHTYLDDGRYSVYAIITDSADNLISTGSNSTFIAESQYTDLTSDMEVLFGDVKITSSKVGSAYEYGFNDYYSEQVTLVNISGTTLAGPFGLVVQTTSGSDNIDLLNITGRLADGREYIPLSVDTLKPKAKLKVTVHWAEAEAGATGPVILPVRLIAGPGL